MPSALFLPGSLPTQTAEQSFRTFGRALGQWLNYMPDGEVGTRRYWIDGVAFRVFNGHPEIETIKYPSPENGVEKWWPRGRHDEFGFRVRPGVKNVRFGDPGWRLGFARDAVNSYALFRYIKKDGIIPQGVRFQVCIPLVFSAVRFFFPDEDVEKVGPGFTEATRAEVAKIVEMIPNDDLAIQFDLAVENRYVDTALDEHGPEAAKKEGARVCAPLADICSAIPPAVHLGHHMCFGTLNGWPSRTPPTLAGTIILANSAIAASGRKVDFVHIPTLASSEDAWFAPLKDLKADGADIYMGAIHHLHGPGGMGDQLRVMKKYLSDFGLGSPCGFGRAADRSDRLITDDGSKVADPIQVILDDHRKAAEMLRDVLKH
jgi:hypothetical protein